MGVKILVGILCFTILLCFGLGKEKEESAQAFILV